MWSALIALLTNHNGLSICRPIEEDGLEEGWMAPITVVCVCTCVSKVENNFRYHLAYMEGQRLEEVADNVLKS